MLKYSNPAAESTSISATGMGYSSLGVAALRSRKSMHTLNEPFFLITGTILEICHTLIFDPPEMTYLQDFHQDKTSTQSSHSSIWYLIEDAQRQESSGKGSINTKISL